jgi:hypothetical protein
MGLSAFGNSFGNPTAGGLRDRAGPPRSVSNCYNLTILDYLDPVRN